MIDWRSKKEEQVVVYFFVVVVDVVGRRRDKSFRYAEERNNFSSSCCCCCWSGYAAAIPSASSSWRIRRLTCHALYLHHPTRRRSSAVHLFILHTHTHMWVWVANNDSGPDNCYPFLLFNCWRFESRFKKGITNWTKGNFKKNEEEGEEARNLSKRELLPVSLSLYRPPPPGGRGQENKVKHSHSSKFKRNNNRHFLLILRRGPHVISLRGKTQQQLQ